MLNKWCFYSVYLYCGLVRLGLDSQRLTDSQLRHVCQSARLSINAPWGAALLSVLCLEQQEFYVNTQCGNNCMLQAHSMQWGVKEEEKKKNLGHNHTHPKGCENADGGGSTVLDEGARDDLKCLGHGTVWPLLNTSEGSWTLQQPVRHSHLYSSPTWQQTRLQQDITAHLHCIL